MGCANTRITISVVVYRDYDSPLEMINSLVENTRPSLKIKLYVVDNSDLDKDDPLITNRSAFVEKIGKFGFVEYVDAGGNIGFGAANNIALEKSRAEYHAFVNPDIVFIEDALDGLLTFMETHSEVGMCIPRIVDESGNIQCAYRRNVTVLDAFNRMFLKNALKRRDRTHCLKDNDYTKPFFVPFGQGSFLFGRTSILKSLKGFDEAFFMYLEDADLCRRVNQVSKLFYSPNVTVVHKWEKGSHKSLVLLMHHVKSYATYFKKWGMKLA